LKRFESEIAFLLRTFFFVYMGLIVSIGDIKTIMVGVILSLTLLLSRFAAVKIATARCSELADERPIMSVMLTRGLAAAVLATLPMQYAAENPIFSEIASIYINIAVWVILTTAIIAAVGIPLLKRKTKRTEKG